MINPTPCLTPKYHSSTFSALHNAMERKRRDSIKDSFRGLQVHFFILVLPAIQGVYISVEKYTPLLLPKMASYLPAQDCIPTLRGDKTSRAQVLKKTGDYIVHMQKKISNHQDEIKELKNQNTQLEVQIRNLEKAKATGGFVGGDLLEVNTFLFDAYCNEAFQQQRYLRKRLIARRI